jgi:hypothetical protein
VAETSDPILREIEEDLREERMASLWKRFGPLVIGAAIALVVAVAGYQIWSGQVRDQRLEAGRQYDTAEEALRAGDLAGAGAAFDAIVADGPEGYALLARFRNAQIAAAEGDAAGARDAFLAIAADGGVEALYADLAALRAAMIGLDVGVAPDTLLAELAPLTDDADPWRYVARETSALAELKAGNAAAAKAVFDGLIADAATPAGVRARAQAIAATLPEAGS